MPSGFGDGDGEPKAEAIEVVVEAHKLSRAPLSLGFAFPLPPFLTDE